jgi:membrane protein DedA with SNARE-associated domain
VDWLGSVPPIGVYSVVALVIGLQFLCLPLPGGVALTTAALLALGDPRLELTLVAASAVLGVVAGATAGHQLGRRGGRALLDRLRRRNPRVLSDRNMARTEAAFARWGVWLAVASCFTAVLRMVAAPLAGTLGLPLDRFLVAVTISAVVWAGGTTAAIYYVGAAVAQSWLVWISWVGLAMLAVFLAASVPAWVHSRRRQQHSR